MFLFLGLFIAPGFFLLGLGVRIKTIFLVVFGLAFGGIAMLMALVPFFNAWPMLRVPLAVAGAVIGDTGKARARHGIGVFRPAPADGAVRGWVVSGTSSGSSPGGSFRGGSSGGRSRAARRRRRGGGSVRRQHGTSGSW